MFVIKQTIVHVVCIVVYVRPVRHLRYYNVIWRIDQTYDIWFPNATNLIDRICAIIYATFAIWWWWLKVEYKYLNDTAYIAKFDIVIYYTLKSPWHLRHRGGTKGPALWRANEGATRESMIGASWPVRTCVHACLLRNFEIFYNNLSVTPSIRTSDVANV